jgi:hypothetical protein
MWDIRCQQVLRNEVAQEKEQIFKMSNQSQLREMDFIKKGMRNA